MFSFFAANNSLLEYLFLLKINYAVFAEIFVLFLMFIIIFAARLKVQMTEVTCKSIVIACHV